MCGILVGWDGSVVSKRRFTQALELLNHRGPDSSNFKFFLSDTVALGHTRLKIIDTSDAANQPFISACGRWSLAYNGEIYNFQGLKAEIGDRWEWRTNSDTEVLLACWAMWGTNCLEKLNGMFAFAVYDHFLEKIFLVRDRFGVKPLYFSSQNGSFFASSEINPILFLSSTVNADEGVIRTYLETGDYDHSDRTFFKNVQKISPGSVKIFDIRSETFDDFQWYSLTDNIRNVGGISEEESLVELGPLVDSAVQMHLISDVPAGVNLSGGVDSGYLFCVAREQIPDIQAFTQNFEGYSELNWITQLPDIEERLNISELKAENILSDLSFSVLRQGEPFGGTAIIGYNDMYRNARRKGVKVLLDGNGVDECFLGYTKYQSFLSGGDRHTMKVGSGVAKGRATLISSKHKLSPNVSIDGTYGLAPEVISPKLQRHDLIELPQIEYFDDLAKNNAVLDLLHTKIPRGLRFNDRVSMANSCELRVPFLDHRLVEYSIGLPTNLLLNQKITKKLFRQSASRYLPESIAFAQKRSVQSPQREWFSTKWKEMTLKIIESKSFANRNWVNPKTAKTKFEGFLSGDNKNSFYLWQWLNLELWAREFLD